MRTQDTKQTILDTGYQLIVAKGFTAVGLAELLRVAGVPKGSFYHYFDSKEQFGLALIEAYFEQYLQRLEEMLLRSDKPALERLEYYWQQWQSNQKADAGNGRRCLVAKLSGEVADLSEAMRVALLKGCRAVITTIAACIAEGQRDGSLTIEGDPQALAAAFYYLWLGATVVNKLALDDVSFEIALAFSRASLAGNPLQSR